MIFFEPQFFLFFFMFFFTPTFLFLVTTLTAIWPTLTAIDDNKQLIVISIDNNKQLIVISIDNNKQLIVICCNINRKVRNKSHKVIGNNSRIAPKQ